MSALDRGEGPRRVLRGVAATLSLTVYDGDLVVDPGTLTVTVTRADGTAILTDAATSGTGAAARTVALTAAQTADLDELALVWSGASGATYRTSASIVGGHYFTIAAARAFDKRQLEDAADYPAATLEEARDRIAAAIEAHTGVAFVPRYRLAVVDGLGRDTLLLDDGRVRSVRSVETRDAGTATWTALTAGERALVTVDPAGILTWESTTWPAGTRNVRVGYEYGEDRPPLDVARAALKWMAYQLVASNLPERATSLSDELGTFSLWTPGLRGAVSGIPEVDEVLAAYAERRIAVG